MTCTAHVRLLIIVVHEICLQRNAKGEPQRGTSPWFECILPQDVVTCVLVDARDIERLPNGSQDAGEQLCDKP